MFVSFLSLWVLWELNTAPDSNLGILPVAEYAYSKHLFWTWGNSHIGNAWTLYEMGPSENSIHRKPLLWLGDHRNL